MLAGCPFLPLLNIIGVRYIATVSAYQQAASCCWCCYRHSLFFDVLSLRVPWLLSRLNHRVMHACIYTRIRRCHSVIASFIFFYFHFYLAIYLRLYNTVYGVPKFFKLLNFAVLGAPMKWKFFDFFFSLWI